jgi:hypothetical protein
MSARVADSGCVRKIIIAPEKYVMSLAENAAKQKRTYVAD